MVITRSLIPADVIILSRGGLNEVVHAGRPKGEFWRAPTCTWLEWVSSWPSTLYHAPRKLERTTFYCLYANNISQITLRPDNEKLG